MVIHKPLFGATIQFKVGKSEKMEVRVDCVIYVLVEER